MMKMSDSTWKSVIKDMKKRDKFGMKKYGKPLNTETPKDAASSGSNLAATSDNLAASVKGRIEALRKVDPENKMPIPVDLVTASGSGLDPHISVAAAEYQAGRDARIRGLSLEEVKQAVAANTENPQFVVLGEARVNVLKLNLKLDEISAK